MYLPPLTKKSFNYCLACFYPQGLYAPQRHLYLHLGDAFNCHLALSWLNNEAQAEGMLSGLMRPSVKEGCCVGTTKGCSLNSPPVDQSGPAGGFDRLREHTLSLPQAAGARGASVASVAHTVRGLAAESSKWRRLRTQHHRARCAGTVWHCDAEKAQQWRSVHRETRLGATSAGGLCLHLTARG